jgi:hypothetical protein
MYSFVLCGDPRIPNPGPEKIVGKSPPRNKFTTNMREVYDDQTVYQQVLQTEVVLPLGAILAMSPGLEKKMSADTKLHVVPVTHARSLEAEDAVMEVLAGFHHNDALEPQETAYANAPRMAAPARYIASCSEITPATLEHFQNVADAYAARKVRHMAAHQRQLTAPTGAIIINIGEEEGAPAMIDTGAEMNLVTPHLAKSLRKRYAVDELGKEFRMKNASGNINNLRGCFNSLPLEIGGKRCDTSFFIGDSWDSEFHIILGQPFLRRYSCGVNWVLEDEQVVRMFLHLYPNGLRDKPPIVAEMFETNALKDRGMTALVGWAGVYQPCDSAPDEHQSHDRFTEPDPSAPEFDPQYDNIPEDSIPLDLEETVPEVPPTECEEEYLQLSDLEGYASVSSNEEPESDAEIRAVEMAPASARVITTAEELEQGFHEATNDCRTNADLPSEAISLERAKEVYQQKLCNALRRIPIGNRFLIIEEGEHYVRINLQPFHMLLDPQAAYSVITSRALQRAGLHKMAARTTQHRAVPSCVSKPGLAYCTYVPIDLGTRPVLPGLFLITNSHLPGGYDIICGKPWMIGLERHYARHQFDSSSKPGVPWPNKHYRKDTSDSSLSQSSDENSAGLQAPVIPIYYYTREDLVDTSQPDSAPMDSSDSGDLVTSGDAVNSYVARTVHPPERGGTFARSL